jgi:glycogen(starch) synthase
MRVMTVGNMYPPHHFGGYELVWRSAVEHLRSGHAVRVLTTDFDNGAAAPDDPDVHRELQWHFHDGGFDRLGFRASRLRARYNHRVLRRHLDAFRPDVVSWWAMGGMSLTLIEEVRRRGLPAVAFVHDEWLDYSLNKDRWLRIWSGPRRGRFAALGELIGGVPARVDFGAAAEYVFVSEHTRQHVLQCGRALPRTSIAHSGIHEDYLAPAPPQPWSWQLLYVGRLDPRKGVDTAVRALADLPAAHLTIAGGWDDVEEARLQSLATELGVSARIHFAGQCDRAALISLYEAADVVLFPVRWNEPWGLVPLEAMAKGRPVVATGRGGSGEYLRDGENCLLFDAESPAALAGAVQRLAEDPELRRGLRGAGIATAARHTETIFNQAVEAAMMSAVAA